jgi:hypothetical protein
LGAGSTAAAPQAHRTGTEGVIDVAQLVEFTGVFEPLRNAEFFARVMVNPELGTVCWPNGADLDSEVLYSKIVGVSIPEYVQHR